jgi:hypothetical protein
MCVMKKILGISVLAFLLLNLINCTSPKPYYDTAVGKKKQRYYNDIQYGRNEHPKKKF